MKKSFTLAEIMIVLTVIAVLTAILLPAAKNAMPNEKVIKFKKAHNTLYSVIQELVTSDKYYIDGDLGKKPNGTTLSPYDAEDKKYLIATMADVLNTNYSEPTEGDGRNSQFGFFENDCIGGSITNMLNNCSGKEVTPEIITKKKNQLSTYCNRFSSQQAKQIITSDGAWYWDPFPTSVFGITEFAAEGTGRRVFHLSDNNGLIYIYKIFCMDIDGVPENATEDDCINECPFGYGIRVDGKIVSSTKADQWLEKNIQDNQ